MHPRTFMVHPPLIAVSKYVTVRSFAGLLVRYVPPWPRLDTRLSTAVCLVHPLCMVGPAAANQRMNIWLCNNPLRFKTTHAGDFAHMPGADGPLLNTTDVTLKQRPRSVLQTVGWRYEREARPDLSAFIARMVV